jgi:hypothetical protein
LEVPIGGAGAGQQADTITVPTFTGSRVAVANQSLGEDEIVLQCGGNVSARVRRGRLVLVGDELNNCVRVEQTGRRAFLLAGLAGTTINGRPDAVIFGGVRKKIDLLLAAGDDSIQFGSAANPTLLPRLQLDTGPGDDTIVFDHVLHKAKLRAMTGPGADLVRTVDTILQQSCWFDLVADHTVDGLNGLGECRRPSSRRGRTE